MNRLVVLISLLVLHTAFDTYAQDNKMSVGITAGFTFPIGDFGKKYNSTDVLGEAGNAGLGNGGTITFGYNVAPKFEAGLEVGYLTFGENKSVFGDLKFNVIPIWVKGRYFFMESKWQPFAVFGLGFHNTNLYYKGTFKFNANVFTLGGKAGAGVKHAIDKQIDLDLGVDFNYFITKDKKYKDGDQWVKPKFNVVFIGINVGAAYRF